MPRDIIHAPVKNAQRHATHGVVNNCSSLVKDNHELRHYKWSESSRALPEAASTSRDTVPDLRAIESRSEVAVSQINRRLRTWR